MWQAQSIGGKRMSNRKTLPIIAVIIVFIIYNIVVFSFSGLIGFTRAFWTSYISVILFSLTLLGMFIYLGQAGMTRRDWFFGIPILKHTIVYGVLTVIYAIVFMIFGNRMYIAIPISIMSVTWAVYIIMFLSCLYIKENSDVLISNNREKSSFIQGIRSRMDYLIKIVDDPLVKEDFANLKELTDSSMPYTYSGKDNIVVEKEIITKLDELELMVNDKNYDASKKLCGEITNLLHKRNLL